MGKKRVTVVIDEGILKKLRLIQSKSILKESNHVSLSSVINYQIKIGLKNFETKV
jgi:hypothetical protein